jgi:thiamine-monophosphate kinase
VPLSEKLLIDRVRRAATSAKHRPGKGIGDDCAVLPLPRGHQALVTTDFSLENVHFRREWHPPDSVGHRCLARGLSDIAAMGGIPRAAFLSLALPTDLPQSWVDKFVAGLLKLATRFSVSLAGGDTAQSPDGVLADIVVLGSVPAGQAILRSGARPGDLIYVTGDLGSAFAALNQLRDGKKLRPKSHPKHFYPEPRIAIGKLLREKKLASAMIDISDGLSTDLAHICDESQVGALVYADALPTPAKSSQARSLAQQAHSSALHTLSSALHTPSPALHNEGSVSGHDFSRAEHRAKRARALAPEASALTLHNEGFVSGHGFSRAEHRPEGIRALAPEALALTLHNEGSVSGHGFRRAEHRPEGIRALAPETLVLALHGGEEYELLFTAPRNRRIPKQIAGVPVTRIGEVIRGRQMKLVDAMGKSEIFKPAGWEHFGG